LGVSGFLVGICLAIGFFCSFDDNFGEGRRGGCRFNFGYGNSDGGDLAIAGLWVWVGGRWRELAGIAPRTLIFLALSGVATGLSWLCYFRALQLGQATAVTTVDKSGLVLVLVLSVLFLGEPLSWKVVLGMLLMLAGTLVVIL
jgi:uncharacterized membrane protein